MTFEQAKDQVAVKHGYDNWVSLHCRYLISKSETHKWKYFEEAAKLYAKSKWDEACEAQIELCSQSARTKSISCGDPMACGCQGTCDHPYVSVNRSSIKNAPKPEFKP